MAKFKFNAGAEFDILTQKELREEVDRLEKEMKLLREGVMEVWKRPGVRRYTGTGQNTGAAAATTSIRVPGPSQGFTWDIRRIAITGQDSSAVVAGATGSIFRNQPNQALSLVDIVASIPWKETYSSQEFTLEAMEDLVIVVFAMPNAGNGSTIFISGQAVEYPTRGHALQVI